MPMNGYGRQGGFLLIVAIVLVVVASMLAVTIAMIAATSGSSATDNLQSGQALFLADSGLEFEARRMAQNLDWYRSSADPTTSVTQNFGAGNFTVSTNLPATELSARVQPAATSVTVFTSNRFPTFAASPSPPTTCNPCYLALGDVSPSGGGEFVTYNAISGNTFTVTRAQSPGGYAPTLPSPPTATTQARGTPVYPVTTVSTATSSGCASTASIRLVAHPKFLNAGTINIEGEEIQYTGSSTSSGVTTLTGITRCADGLSAGPSYAVGTPVTPVLFNDASTNYETQINSTGTVGNTSRTEQKTVQRP